MISYHCWISIVYVNAIIYIVAAIQYFKLEKQMDGDQAFNDMIDPPNSAAGFHRSKPEQVQISGDNSKTGTESDMVTSDTKEQFLKSQAPTGCTKYCSIDYYKQFFDVCQLEVMSRLKASLSVPPNEDFIERTNNKPDFYGPFWLLTTLVALLGTVGNLSYYILSKFSSSESFSGYFFHLEQVRYAFVFVYTYGFGVPAGIYFSFRVFTSHLKLELPDIICIYGYSLAPFLLAVVLCIIPIGFLQWLILFAACGASSLFLFKNLKNHCETAQPLVLMGLIGGLQLVLALTIKIVFLNLLP